MATRPHLPRSMLAPRAALNVVLLVLVLVLVPLLLLLLVLPLLVPLLIQRRFAGNAAVPREILFISTVSCGSPNADLRCGAMRA